MCVHAIGCSPDEAAAANLAGPIVADWRGRRRDVVNLRRVGCERPGDERRCCCRAPVETSTTLQCIQISRILARITVGRTHGTKLGLNIGKATGCNIAETDGAWDVYIYRRDAKGSIVDNETEDIQQDSCPVLSAHVKGLSAPRLTNPQWWVKPVTGVAVGPFFIENPAGLLRLGSEHDRHATEKWLRGTLAAVRSCWNHQDFGDGSHRLADRFYAAIGL